MQLLPSLLVPCPEHFHSPPPRSHQRIGEETKADPCTREGTRISQAMWIVCHSTSPLLILARPWVCFSSSRKWTSFWTIYLLGPPSQNWWAHFCRWGRRHWIPSCLVLASYSQSWGSAIIKFWAFHKSPEFGAFWGWKLRMFLFQFPSFRNLKAPEKLCGCKML